MIVYKATNKINEKVYIGISTKSLEWRVDKHKWDSKRPQHQKSYFYRAIRKYGFDNFVWDIIDIAQTLEELHEKEKYWIKQYGSFDDKTKGYNSTSGGEGGYTLTKEECAARSERAKGENNPMYGVPSPMKGKKFSEDHKRKISEALSKSYRPHMMGSTNPSARCIRNIDTGLEFGTMKEATEYYPTATVNGICSVCKGRSKTNGGYKWEYVD